MFCGMSLPATELTANLVPDRTELITLTSPADDAAFANPSGYFPASPPAHRVVETVTIENTGSTPIASPTLRVNGRPFLTVGDPFDILGLNDDASMLDLYAAWTARRVHGTTDLDGTNRRPLDVLRFLGVTFCGDDTRALATLARARGIDARHVPVAGHVVAEFRPANGPWSLFDGDQNAFYLQLDNQTVASAADILSDPFLALRTRVYGRQATWNPAAAWQNASRFDFADAEAGKSVKTTRRSRSPAWTLFPGEKLVFRPALSPDFVLGATPDLQRDRTLRGATVIVEFHADLAARHRARVGLTLPYPALRRSSPAGETLIAKPGQEPEKRIPLPASSGTAVIVCQASTHAVPPLHRGSNVLRFEASSRSGSLTVIYGVNSSAAELVPPPAPRIRAAETFDHTPPRFAIDAPDADNIWWQISTNSAFTFVPPNLDSVRKFSPDVAITAAEDLSFLSPDTPHFFRAKIRVHGVWSAWSEPVKFSVRKPAQPRLVSLERLPDLRVRLTWEPHDAEMLFFGSDRFDFLPESFAEEEPIAMENGRVTASRRNRNLLVRVPAGADSIVVEDRPFFRLIARHRDTFSVPSGLIHAPAIPDGSVPRVLQTRHLKDAGDLTGRDRAAEILFSRSSETTRENP